MTLERDPSIDEPELPTRGFLSDSEAIRRIRERIIPHVASGAYTTQQQVDEALRKEIGAHFGPFGASSCEVGDAIYELQQRMVRAGVLNGTAEKRRIAREQKAQRTERKK